MAIREDMVSSAITFLSDSKVQNSPLAKRLAFLESKGLTQEEITEVLNRLNNPLLQQQSTSSSSSSHAPPVPQYAPYGSPYGQPPEPPGRDWRDWFIMAVVTSGVSYGLYTLAKVLTPLVLFADCSDMLSPSLNLPPRQNSKTIKRS
jgi:peroxin-14